jgi:hypothetical protein
MQSFTARVTETTSFSSCLAFFLILLINFWCQVLIFLVDVSCFCFPRFFSGFVESVAASWSHSYSPQCICCSKRPGSSLKVQKRSHHIVRCWAFPRVAKSLVFLVSLLTRIIFWNRIQNDKYITVKLAYNGKIWSWNCSVYARSVSYRCLKFGKPFCYSFFTNIVRFATYFIKNSLKPRFETY